MFYKNLEQMVGNYLLPIMIAKMKAETLRNEQRDIVIISMGLHKVT